MKRFIVGLVLIIISGFITIVTTGDAQKEETVTLYSIDGRIEWIEVDKIEEQLTVGWFLEPQILLYSIDGRTEYVNESQVEEQLTVGWYLEPQVLLYAANGRQQHFNESEVEAQLTVGWYKHKPYDLNTREGRACYIYDYLTAKGFSKKAICAILGNMQQESDIKAYTGSGSYGLVQWTGGRKKSLFNYCGTTSPDLRQQLDYLIYELNNGYTETLKILQNDNLSLDEMTHRFERTYERAGIPATSKRQKYARNWYNFVF